MATYQIEQSVHNGATWEPISGPDCATLAEARATMAESESIHGWRDLRIVEIDDETERRSVVEYGAKS